MEAFFHGILSYILAYKYGAIFILTAVASFGVPVPGTALVMASGAFVDQGYFDFFPVFFAAWLGNVTGNNIAYWIFRTCRTRLYRTSAVQTIVDSHEFHTLEQSMGAYALPLIFFTRFAGTVGSLTNIAAGCLKMPYRIFFPVGVLGEMVSVFIYCAAGYIFGSHWGYIVSLFSKLWGGMVSGMLIVILLKHQRIFHEKHTQ